MTAHEALHLELAVVTAERDVLRDEVEYLRGEAERARSAEARANGALMKWREDVRAFLARPESIGSSTHGEALVLLGRVLR